MPSIRERTEEWEKVRLSPYATLSVNSKGRQRPEDPCLVRTVFQRDRDRIVHSKAFRRLKGKTQVFMAPEGDHYRTRLTHTLEVSQIARTIARGLSLNEDLTEAIALGHDLGHTPFGHEGEDVLNAIHPGGFSHNRQSLRVVDILERGGLNLTWEVRDGILNHPWKCQTGTLEGRCVQIADRVAYINHDIDDAVRGGIITREDVPQGPVGLLGDTTGKRINTLVSCAIENSLGKPFVDLTPAYSQAMHELREFLFSRVYIGSQAKSEIEKAKGVLKSLYGYYCDYPEEIHLHEDYGDEPYVKACDYVAGMTDSYAIGQYCRIFVPGPWDPED